MTDSAQVRIAEDGKRDAVVVALFRGHYSDLIRLARLLVDDPETAEDVVQDAFAALHRRWRSLADPNAALSYLRAAVANGSRSTLRRRGVVRRNREPAPPDLPSAESQALRHEEQEEITASLRLLPERQRQVVVLRYYLDLSEAEIAATLGISTGAVKSHASRALASMTKRMEQAR